VERDFNSYTGTASLKLAQPAYDLQSRSTHP
jgi:hypothetical protein